MGASFSIFFKSSNIKTISMAFIISWEKIARITFSEIDCKTLNLCQKHKIANMTLSFCCSAIFKQAIYQRHKLFEVTQEPYCE